MSIIKCVNIICSAISDVVKALAYSCEKRCEYEIALQKYEVAEKELEKELIRSRLVTENKKKSSNLWKTRINNLVDDNEEYFKSIGDSIKKVATEKNKLVKEMCSQSDSDKLEKYEKLIERINGVLKMIIQYQCSLVVKMVDSAHSLDVNDVNYKGREVANNG